MSGFGILMLIFGTSVLLTGIYMYTNHKLEILTMRPAFKNLTLKEWHNIGKWTIITSLFIILIGIVGIIFNIK